MDDLEDDPCILAPAAGPCRAQLPRYYYDLDEDNCKKFLYGGCAGNQNNFLSESECLKKCRLPKVE